MILSILDYTALSCDTQDWTAAFAQAICDLTKQGGGTLYVPAGTYPSFSIELKSNITLYLDNGATILFHDDIEKYPRLMLEAEGRLLESYKPLLFADHAENIAVKGQGTLNGQGQCWWEAHRNRTINYYRPCLIQFQHCRNVTLQDITVTNSPFWTVHPLYCDNVWICGLNIINPPDSSNTDGIDPDSCTNVRILDCTIDVGDDCIAIKCGTEALENPKPSENITITGCTMLHGHGGVVLGSEMSGGIRNVVISNCVFYETDRGIRIKTRRRRGGIVEDITVSNIVMDKVLCPFVVNLFYWGGKIGKQPFVSDRNPAPVDAGTPLVHNIQINNIIAKNVTSCAAFLTGLPERSIENVQFTNCTVTMDASAKPELPAMLLGIDPMAGAGFYVRNASGIVFDNVVLKNAVGPDYDLDETAEIIRR
ncbi:MAG: glycoside hydrolase family 28 protein [Firmicutes bacterium]|nr:glycoside hydrolase family 28 protein [Bacillota bacterium]